MPWAWQRKIFIRLCTLLKIIVHTVVCPHHWNTESGLIVLTAVCDVWSSRVRGAAIELKSLLSFSQFLLFPCCLIKILGVLQPSGAFFSPARTQILSRSSSKFFCTGQTHTGAVNEESKYVFRLVCVRIRDLQAYKSYVCKHHSSFVKTLLAEIHTHCISW